jgi:hypothetical protein
MYGPIAMIVAKLINVIKINPIVAPFIEKII